MPFGLQASAADDRGGLSWATQSLMLAAYPFHWLVPGGFRTSGAFKLCMAGETGRDCQVLASTNVSGTNWLPLRVMEATSGTWRLLDPDAADHARRFHRAEQLP